LVAIQALARPLPLDEMMRKKKCNSGDGRGQEKLGQVARAETADWRFRLRISLPTWRMVRTASFGNLPGVSGERFERRFCVSPQQSRYTPTITSGVTSMG